SAADGTFQIANVPPGTYTVETWHERYGTQTVQVTVAAQETADVQATYREQMAENAVVPLGRPIHLHDHPAGAHAGAAAGGRRAPAVRPVTPTPRAGGGRAHELVVAGERLDVRSAGRLHLLPDPRDHGRHLLRGRGAARLLHHPLPAQGGP